MEQPQLTDANRRHVDSDPDPNDLPLLEMIKSITQIRRARELMAVPRNSSVIESREKKMASSDQDTSSHSSEDFLRFLRSKTQGMVKILAKDEKVFRDIEG